MRSHHYRRRTKEPPELDVTTFLNLMVVLVPFLLITAVFSRIAIVELNLPSSTGGPAAEEVGFRVEVIVREGGLEIGNGKSVIAAVPKVDESYDLATLSNYLMSLKRDHPDTDAASVLLEPQIEYDHLIQVMDVVRSAEVPAEKATDAPDLPRTNGNTNGIANGNGIEHAYVHVALFPEISIGDAP
jgi:biopolymer transport protein ExbD